MGTATKPKIGRPRVINAPVRRTTLYLTASERLALAQLGNGSMSRGARLLVAHFSGFQKHLHDIVKEGKPES